MDLLFNINELSIKMNKTNILYKKDIATLRTGRANPCYVRLNKNRCLWTKDAY